MAFPIDLNLRVFSDGQEGHYSDEAGSVSCKSCDMTANGGELVNFPNFEKSSGDIDLIR